MTKKQRRVLTIIILIASMGLIFAQTIWIFGVFTNMQNAMNDRVIEALGHVVTKVEQAETLTQLSMNNAFNLNTGNKSDILEDKKKVDSIVKSEHLISDSLIDIIEQREDSPMVNRFFVESYLRLLTSEIPVEQRVSMEQLDTLIYRELKEVGINIDFNFRIAVCDKSKNPIMTSDNYEPKTRHTIHKKRLFPSDPEGFSETYFVSLYFPEETQIVLARIWPLIFSAFVLIVAIFTIFFYTMYVIARQKRVSEIKGDFISNITHELKTPISTISLAAQMLGDENIPQAAKDITKLSNMIKIQSKQLSYLVEKVLQTSVFERQTIVLSKSNVSLHAVIKEADDIMTLQLRSRKATLITELRAKDDVILTDRSYFVNVITNLLDNALKYSSDVPKIVIGTRNEYDKILCYVSDNGIGISPENKSRIFDQFFRVYTGDVHDVKGFGLGLNYVKKIVDLTGGTISVESEIDIGTTFYIWLPLVNNNNNT
jgi:two-component system phosphate regulon sensor histidine kinase PhoR